MEADYHAVILILWMLCSWASKLGCCSSHTNKNAVFYLCCQVETICCGNWRETSNSRVSHQQKVQTSTWQSQALGRFTFHLCNVSECTFLIVINRHLKTLEMMSDTLISSAWLKGSAQSTVGKLDHKISILTGLNVKHPYGEYLQVVNYGIGGHYEPHFDHATVSLLWDLFYKLIIQFVVYVDKQWYSSNFPVPFQSCVQTENRESSGNFYDICEWFPALVILTSHHDLDRSKRFLGRFLSLFLQSLN